MYHSLLSDKENCFVCLFTMAFSSGKRWASFLTTIPYGMHLVVPTHHFLFWVVCHPSKTFPPKKFEREPQNKLPLLPTVRPYPYLPLTHDPPLLYWLGTDWWCLALHVLHFCVCPKLVCCSCICHGLEAHLCILLLILDLLWRELFSDLPFFIACFLQGLSLA